MTGFWVHDVTMTDTTAPTAPTGAPGLDPRPAFAQALAAATPIVEGVRPDQLDGPTPCTGMDVRYLLGHLVMAGLRAACAGRGDDLSTWPGEVTGVADDGWGAAWQEVVAQMPTAWADDTRLTTDVVMPWATMSGADVVHVYMNEVICHTWDLARATGQQAAWDDDTLQVALDGIKRQLPDDPERARMFEEAKASMPPGVPWRDPFGPIVAVPDGAPLIDRLVAWSGRDPR